MSDKKDLTKYTKVFFDKHWGFEEDAPKWDYSWDMRGPVPNYLLGGVYALLRKEELVYIGKGICRGAGIYKDRGISTRLMKHVVYSGRNRPYGLAVLRKRWKDVGVTSVATLGFPKELNYLASSLEDFLLLMMTPQENKQMSKKT